LERAGAEAWSRGEQEDQVKKALWEKKADEKRCSFDLFIEMRDKSRLDILEKRGREIEPIRMKAEDFNIETKAAPAPVIEVKPVEESIELENIEIEVEVKTEESVPETAPETAASSSYLDSRPLRMIPVDEGLFNPPFPPSPSGY